MAHFHHSMTDEEYNDRHGDGWLIRQMQDLRLDNALDAYLAARWATGTEAVAAVERARAAVAKATTD